MRTLPGGGSAQDGGRGCEGERGVAHRAAEVSSPDTAEPVTQPHLSARPHPLCSPIIPSRLSQGISFPREQMFMITVSSFLLTAGYVLGAVRELARYAFGFCWALVLPKAVLAARVLAAGCH